MTCTEERVVESEIMPYLSPSIAQLMRSSGKSWRGLEEIRLRSGQPILFRLAETECTMNAKGTIERDLGRGYIVTPEDIKRTIASISDNSFYAFEEEIRRGYITIPGGHRVGLAGQVLVKQGDIKTMKEFSSMAIRIASQVLDCSHDLLSFLYQQGGTPLNTLIVSAPRCGKTTILRDIARNFSQGTRWGKPCSVVVVDERSELGGSYHGQVQMDLGPRTDVLDACPKAIGMMMAIRSLSPDVIITDEIGRREDVEAVHECLNAGVAIVASVHARDLEELKQRPQIRELLQAGVFANRIVLSRRKGPGTVEEIVR